MKREMSKEEREYRRFMYNPKNVKKCGACPENQGCDDFQHRLPCGQWYCWVELHCGGGNDDE